MSTVVVEKSWGSLIDFLVKELKLHGMLGISYEQRGGYETPPCHVLVLKERRQCKFLGMSFSLPKKERIIASFKYFGDQGGLKIRLLDRNEKSHIVALAERFSEEFQQEVRVTD